MSSYMFNAAQDPFAMAYQTERQNLLSNPAYSTSNNQFSIGAYGTIGGVPLNMLNLPAGLGNTNANSIIQQFDMQNGGILDLAEQLGGPNSQYSQLMQKYQTALVVDQEKQKYQQAIQLQQLQTQRLQQQLAAARQQQAFVAQSAFTATNAAPQRTTTTANGFGGGTGALLALALLLMQSSDRTPTTSASNSTNTNTPAPAPTPTVSETLLTNEDTVNSILRDLGVDPLQYTSINSKTAAIESRIDSALDKLNVTDTAILNGTLEAKARAYMTQKNSINGMLTQFNITAPANASIDDKIALLLADTQANTEDPLDIAKNMAAIINVSITDLGLSTDKSKLQLLQRMSSTANQTKLDTLIRTVDPTGDGNAEALNPLLSGTLKEKVVALLRMEPNLDNLLSLVGNGSYAPILANHIQEKAERIRIRAREVINTQKLAAPLAEDITFQNAVNAFETARDKAETLVTKYLGEPRTTEASIAITDTLARIRTTANKTRINNYLISLTQLDNTALTSRGFSADNITLIGTLRAKLTPDTSYDFTANFTDQVITISQIFDLINQDTDHHTGHAATQTFVPLA